MSTKTPAEKAHLSPGTTVAVLNSVPGVIESLGLREPSFVEPADAQLVVLIARNRAELESLMRPAASQLAPGAALWVLFRKGASSAGLDMSRNDVWAIAEELGMRPLGLLSIDEDWSAFRLKRG